MLIYLLVSKAGTEYVTYRYPMAPGAVNNRGAIIKTDNVKEAYPFLTKGEAEQEKGRASKLLRDFSVQAFDASVTEIVRTELIESLKSDAEEIGENPEEIGIAKNERIQMGREARKAVYRKTNGCCYICGQFQDFDDFEVEHKVPLSKGGTNDLSNLFCACHLCNIMKGTIKYEDLIEQAMIIADCQREKNYSGKRVKP